MMARLMLSAGMLLDLALSMAIRRRGFPDGSPPPDFAAMVISLMICVKIFPRRESVTAFFLFIVAHFE
jgi:hypothetical protein